MQLLIYEYKKKNSKIPSELEICDLGEKSGVLRKWNMLTWGSGNCQAVGKGILRTAYASALYPIFRQVTPPQKKKERKKPYWCEVYADPIPFIQ